MFQDINEINELQNIYFDQITSLVHEAKGMDNGPRLSSKLLSMQDFTSNKILQKILTDEVRHVAYGVEW